MKLRVLAEGARRVASALDGRALAWVFVIAVAGLVAARAMQPLREPDFGWHAALGRYIVEQRTIPDRDPFTHTARGAPMVAHEWLSQVIYHGVIQSAGLFGLRTMHAFFLAGILLLFFAMLRRSGVPPACALLGVFAYVVIARSRFHLRPQTFSVAFMMVMYFAIFVRRPRLSGPQIGGITAAAVLWANLHSAVILLPMLCWLYLVVEAVQQRSGWRLPRSDDLGGGSLPRLTTLALASSAAVFITPAHFRLIPYVVESLRINSGLSAEWFPIQHFFGHPLNQPFETEAFLIVVIATAATVLSTARGGSLSRVAVVVYLTCLPFQAQRTVMFFFAPILFVLSELAVWMRSSPPGADCRRLAALAAIPTVVFLALPAIHPHTSPERVRSWLGADANFEPVAFPADAVRFLDAVELRGRLFHLERWGGFLLFHTYDEYPIFIDGRWVTVGERVARDALLIERRLPGTFERIDAYGIDLLLVPRGWMTDEIARERGWISVFENFNAGIYIRSDPRSRGDLRRCQAYYAARGIPFDPAQGFDGLAAQNANRRWARGFRVSRRHLDHFRLWGSPTGIAPNRIVDAW